jgi:hypothetical protein
VDSRRRGLPEAPGAAGAAMIAAIYTRKSTAQNTFDEEESTRQIEHASAYAKRKGWVVAEERIHSRSSPATFRQIARSRIGQEGRRLRWGYERPFSLRKNHQALTTGLT